MMEGVVTMQEQILDDVLMEVLSYLPAKEIFRLRCLSKAANGFPSECFFSILQSTRIAKDCGVFIKNHPTGPAGDLSPIDAYSGVPSKFVVPHTANVLGCSNGLVVYEDEVADVAMHAPPALVMCICNPITREEQHIPHPSNPRRLLNAGVVLVFGYGCKNKIDYKLACWTPVPEWSNDIEFRVYSSKESSWKPTRLIDFGPREIKNERPVVIGESIYFVSNCGSYMTSDPYVLAININDEGSRMLPLPPLVGDMTSLIADRDGLDIAEWGGKRSSSICLVRWCSVESTFRIWVMEDRKKWAWSETCMEVTMESMGLLSGVEVERFTFINGETLVFNVGRIMLVYELKDGAVKRRLYKRLEENYPTFFCYANTLCPCQ